MQSLRKDKNYYKEKKGFAIAIVLLVTTLVIVLALEFNYEMRVEASITMNSLDSLRAYYLAKSGIEAGIFIIRMDYKNDVKNKQFVDHLGEIWNIPSVSIPLGEGSIKGSISDESGKVNLNSFVVETAGNKKKGAKGESKSQQKINVVRRIIENFPVKPEESPQEIIHALTEWKGELFEDDEALEAYYANLKDSYESKWDFFDDMSELLLVKGITKEFYFQERKKTIENVGKSTPNNKKRNPHYTLEDVFTVYSYDPENNDYKININTAPKPVLRALHSQMDESAVEAIISRQQSGEPFKNVAEVGKIDELKPVFQDEKDGLKGIRNLIDVKSYFFKIVATGTYGDISKTIEAVVYRNPSNGSINIKSWAVY
ncbi:MAG: hypothetical protein D6734_10250 [Candidatus Schekmanbacteria bacterium]|nr:MAG: hypothetical protein D6734_10250 [Candidatus Schekmanbacteria bacterium]